MWVVILNNGTENKLIYSILLQLYQTYASIPLNSPAATTQIRLLTNFPRILKIDFGAFLFTNRAECGGQSVAPALRREVHRGRRILISRSNLATQLVPDKPELHSKLISKKQNTKHSAYLPKLFFRSSKTGSLN